MTVHLRVGQMTLAIPDMMSLHDGGNSLIGYKYIMTVHLRVGQMTLANPDMMSLHNGGNSLTCIFSVENENQYDDKY